MSMLVGKKGLVIEIANDKSIAWGCTKAFYDTGEKLDITYLNANAEKYVLPLAQQLQANLLTPDLEAGNVLLKQLSLFSNADVAGIVEGAKVPIILTSRSSDVSSRKASSALALLLIHKRQ